MLLRASSHGDETPDLKRVMNDDGTGSGVAAGDEIVALVDATLGGNDAALLEARRHLVDRLGEEALIDVAGVIAAFSMQNRVADGVGLPLDAPFELATRQQRVELGIDRFGPTVHGHASGRFFSLLERIASGLFPIFLRVAGRIQRLRAER